LLFPFNVVRWVSSTFPTTANGKRRRSQFVDDEATNRTKANQRTKTRTMPEWTITTTTATAATTTSATSIFIN
jgi:hypothetical protein